MPQTSSRAATSRRNRGITLIELSVVVVVIVMMAALAERNFSHTKEGLAQQAFTAGLRAEVTRAHLQAIKDGQTVTLNYDPAGSQFTLTEPPLPDTSGSQPPELITDMQNQTQGTAPIHTLAIPAGVTFTDFTAKGTDQGMGSWQLNFYPDGKCDGGGVQLAIGKSVLSITVDTQGSPTYVKGPLPDSTTNIWPSGIYDQRTTATG